MHIPAQASGGVAVDIEADTLTFGPAQVVCAAGDVVVSRVPDTLRAQVATYDLPTGVIAAVGDVVLRRPPGEVRARRLSYNVHTRAVSAEAVQAALPQPEGDVTYYLQGESVDGTQEEVVAREALFTTCAQHRRHYALRAAEITLRPGQRVVLRGVSLILLNHRLITLPRLAVSLGPERGGPLLFPRLLVGRTDRIGIQTNLHFALPHENSMEAYLVLSARHTLRGGAQVGRFGDLPVGIRVGFKEEATSRFLSGLTVTVIPSLSFFLPSVTGPKGAVQVGLSHPPEPALFLRGDMGGGAWETGQRFCLTAGGSVGRYLEHPTEVISNRLSLAASAEVRPFATQKPITLAAGLRARTALYSRGKHYTVLTPELRTEWHLSPAHTLGMECRTHFTDGDTPFLFDRVDAPRSLALSWQHRNPKRTIGAKLEYDLSVGTMYAWECTYAHRLHCLQPGIVVRRRGEDVTLGVSLQIPGVAGGG